jgi:hypothetical protein
MRIFVSYSRRDGIVTEQTLRLVARYLVGIGTPFIHCLQPRQGKWEQAIVIVALLRSHAVLLVDSPAARTSPWVKFELALARALFRPVFHIDVADLQVVD